MTIAKKRLFIIDTMAMAYRHYFALSRTALMTSKGFPTGAIFGCANFLHWLIAEEHPDYLVAAADGPATTVRHAIYPAYKGTRSAMPHELSLQIPGVQELIAHLGIPTLQIPGYEADDVIASLSRKFATDTLHVYIVSGDKDFLQLLSPNISLYTPKKNGPAQVKGLSELQSEFGLTPRQMIDYLALVGDTVDNIPGVSGIGPKGAQLLLQEYGSLDAIFAHLDKIKSQRQREALQNEKEAAFLSQKLVTLHTDLPLPNDLTALRYSVATKFANPDLAGFYQKLEFKQLLTQLTPYLAKSNAQEAETAPAVTVQRVANKDDWAKLCSAVADAATVAMYCVCHGSYDPVLSQPESILLATPQGGMWEVLLSTGFLSAMALAERQALLDHLIADQTIVITHNLKYQLHLLANAQLHLSYSWWDCRLADYLLDPNYLHHGLRSNLLRHLKQEIAAEDIPGQVNLLLRLHSTLQQQIHDKGLTEVFADIETPLVPVLVAMEKAGIYCDTQILAAMRTAIVREAETLQEQIFAAAGEPFNIQSTKQLQRILFDKLQVHTLVGLKRLRKTKTGFSTDESTLQQLSKHPLPALILSYRSLMKMLNTYIETLPSYAHGSTGRIHTHLRQTVTATGRLSSDNPNMQNIPFRTAWGQRIRAAFCAQKTGYILLSADYSQVEIRLLAHMAHAQDLIRAFQEGIDIHRATAAKVLGIALDAVSKEQRNQAKAVNFGIIYGMGAQRLAQEIGVSIRAAKEFIEKYFAAYPEIKSFTESLVLAARKTGFSTTLCGRIRPIPDLGERNAALAARAANIAVNAPIQGSAADLIKKAMILIAADLEKENLPCRMILQIHDELLFECHQDAQQRVEDIIRTRMTTALALSIPLEISLGRGRDWREAHQ